MGMKRKIAYALTVSLVLCAATASYFYYEQVVIPEKASKERREAINSITSLASKEVDAFMLKTTDDGVTYEEVFKSADRAIENIDTITSKLLAYSQEDKNEQLADAIDYIRCGASVVRHTKSFFDRSMRRVASGKLIENAIESIKNASSKYELSLISKRAEDNIKDLKKHTDERREAALLIAKQCKALIEIGARGRIAEHSLVSEGALKQGLAISQSVLPKEEAKNVAVDTK